ncbi:sigma 54-interacting transcriptional regulator [Metallumcola ferriviriculae]|uniref:Sigma 54-interacting transcriptional regulator n=1 Tax=Metallumcola ferriviriculae TaxID=3039180 RepID=A0AAU0UP24_9FIRM|nr:sigma 54-interacting transcriptional regulator [Desulfitibacteraceae bacterium MK1]
MVSLLLDVFKQNEMNHDAKIMVGILDSIEECVLIINCNLKIVYVNPAYAKILKVPRNRVIGRSLKEIEPAARIIDVIRTGEPIINDPSHIKSLKLDVVANMTPLYYDDSLIGAVAIFRNVTEIKKLNEEIFNLQELTRSLQKQPFASELEDPFNKIIGNSKCLQEILIIANKSAKTNANILIRGESGVGKEVLAQAIHDASKRSEKPVIKVNCAAIPTELLESELFGYEEGAFTGAKKGGKKGKFELADGGTLFLDEIGDMSPSMQAKVLRAIQFKKFERVGGNNSRFSDIRIITATNRNLEKMMEAGTFREDLYFRINVISLDLPPLRKRRGDIPSLITMFLKQLNSDKTLSAEALEQMMSYSWPGNIRELQNAIEHTNIISTNNIIQLEDLPKYVKDAKTSNYNLSEKNLNLSNLIQDVEKKAIITALQITGNNRTKAMSLLGISRRSFYEKLNKYNL